MNQIRHGSATTTHAVQAAIQRSQASAGELSRSYGINPKTVFKWRKWATVDDLNTGSKEPRSTVLSEEEEAIIFAFRRHTYRFGHQRASPPQSVRFTSSATYCTPLRF